MLTLDHYKLITEHEGFRSKPYTCPAGKLTIGYGTNIQDGISKEEAKLLLDYRLEHKFAELALAMPVIHQLDDVRQGVLLNMAYQLGVPRLLHFRKMWTHVHNSNWSKAADEMLDSKWAKQTPNRALQLAEIMRTGVMP